MGVSSRMGGDGVGRRGKEEGDRRQEEKEGKREGKENAPSAKRSAVVVCATVNLRQYLRLTRRTVRKKGGGRGGGGTHSFQPTKPR